MSSSMPKSRRSSVRWPLRSLPLQAAVLAALLLVSARPAKAPDASPEASPEVGKAYEQVASQLLCYCGCARQTLKDCTCGIAFDLRADFERRLAAGETVDAIVAAYLDEHGEQARNEPPRHGFNAIAWYGPSIAIVVAAAFVFGTIALWTRRGRRAEAALASGGSAAGDVGQTGTASGDGAAGSGSPEGTSAADDAMLARIEREMKDIDQ